eukprot:CAMPEP_0197429098 /NCGR_PEP_ID=MMETSP1170-20131217/42985_1 /TAXON_ID=54406 /ORGANISM="Sarcinochrysis sp, Strain CCMP770" /LENGTH=111 /DNA_ID=CAMNT_0042956913 /DNA_START=1 /DNA_END=333 /DNA_ORIENTATION=-
MNNHEYVVDNVIQKSKGMVVYRFTDVAALRLGSASSSGKLAMQEQLTKYCYLEHTMTAAQCRLSSVNNHHRSVTGSRCTILASQFEEAFILRMVCGFTLDPPTLNGTLECE